MNMFFANLILGDAALVAATPSSQKSGRDALVASGILFSSGDEASPATSATGRRSHQIL